MKSMGRASVIAYKRSCAWDPYQETSSQRGYSPDLSPAINRRGVTFPACQVVRKTLRHYRGVSLAAPVVRPGRLSDPRLRPQVAAALDSRRSPALDTARQDAYHTDLFRPGTCSPVREGPPVGAFHTAAACRAFTTGVGFRRGGLTFSERRRSAARHGRRAARLAAPSLAFRSGGPDASVVLLNCVAGKSRQRRSRPRGRLRSTVVVPDAPGPCGLRAGAQRLAAHMEGAAARGAADNQQPER
jgi:hypothetical protein